jgi:transcriptional regulator with XRE-family HTH domain
MPAPSESPFGRELRLWRGRRGLTQLELAHRARTTSRHVSFLETGRSRPSSDMVLRLARTLQVPLRQRNGLLRSAGLAPHFPEHGLDDEALRPFRQVVNQILEKHEPYPAFVIDARWRLQQTNRGGAWALQMFGAPDEPNMLVAMAKNPALRQAIENWAEVVWSGVAGLEADVLATGDPELAEALERAHEALADTPRPEAISEGAAVVCPRIRMGEHTLRTITTVMRFGNAREVTLDELRVELMFPADAVSATLLRQLGEAAGAPG